MQYLEMSITVNFVLLQCHDIKDQGWNTMNRTLLFSGENEMDLTAGHTVMITHDVEIYEETNKPKKIDLKAFSAELKLSKKYSDVKENSFLSGPIKGDATCLPQQKTNFDNIEKIKFDDFLKSLKSTKPFPTHATEVSFLPSEAPEKKLCSSEVNSNFHLQGESNITNVFGGLDSKTAVTQYCLSNETIAPPTCHASEQTGHGTVNLHCGDESMEVTIANTERGLPTGPGSPTVAKQHQKNFESNYSVSYESYKSKPSSHPHGIQQHLAMCINKTTVNNGEAGVSENHGVKLVSRDGLLPATQGISVSQSSFGSMPALDGNKNTVSSSTCSDMEITRNCTALISDANSKEISKCVHSICEKESKTVSRLMERTVFGDSNKDITENQAFTNPHMNGIPHSIPSNETAASEQEVIYGNKELQNLSIKPVSWTSSHLERKEDTLCVSLSSDKSAAYTAKGIDLSRNYVANSDAEQGLCQFLLSDKSAFADLSDTTTVNYKTDRKSGCSNNRMPPIPADKTVRFTISEDMELTKPTAYLIDKSLTTAGFYTKPQEEIRPGNPYIIRPATDKTVVFSLEDNEMETTESCTVAVNHNFMQCCERDLQVLPLQPVDKTVVYVSHNDMNMTKPNTCIIDQSLENSGAQPVHKLVYKTDGRPPTGLARDKTVVFSLTDENEMEITRSHTVALNYGDALQGANIPVAMYVPPDKTVMFPSSEDMEITRPVAGAIDASLKSVTSSLAVLQQGIGTGKKRTTGIASDKTVTFSLGEDNEMEITKSCTVAGNHNFMQHYETVPQVLSLKPVDKTVYASNNGMDRRKPISCIIDRSLENAGAQATHRQHHEADGRAPSGSTRDKTLEFSLSEDNEMEITRSYTVAVNHDTIQQIGGPPQAPSKFPAERSYVLVHNSNIAVNNTTSFIPADKIKVLSHHNDIEITKPIEHVTESTQKKKEKETDTVILPGFVKEERVTFFLHKDNEMEITKSLTVAVNDTQQMKGASEELPLIPAEKTEVSGRNSKTATTVELMESAKGHPMHDQSVSKAGLLIPLNKNSVCQDGKEVNKLPPNTTADQSLEEKQAINKNTKQGLSNTVITSHRITQDLDITRNHTVNIYGPDCYIPYPEKQTLYSVTKSREKTIAFSDGETMEMTRNHTIGIEFMNTNNCNNELNSCSQTESGSEFPPLVVSNEKELDITKTDRRMPEKSSSNMELSVSANKVNTQNLMRIQDHQLESHTSKTNNLAAAAANYVHCHEEKECMLPVEMLVQNPKLCDEMTLNMIRGRMFMLPTESETSKDYPGKLFLSGHEGNPVGVTGSLPVADTAANLDLGRVTNDWQINLDLPSNNFCLEENLVPLSKLPSFDNSCSNVMNPGKKPEFGLISQNGRPSLGEELMKPKDPLELTEGIGIESSNSVVSSELKNKYFTESDPFHVPFSTMQKDNSQIKKLPLGIFPPKLPNKRKSTISNTEDIGGRTKLQDAENSLFIKKSSEKIMQHLSPSHYISEELLPPCLEEMDSSGLTTCELQEKACDVMDKKEITDNEGHPKETNRQKRVRNQEGDELQKEKKLKADEVWSDTTEMKQVGVLIF